MKMALAMTFFLLYFGERQKPRGNFVKTFFIFFGKRLKFADKTILMHQNVILGQNT